MSPNKMNPLSRDLGDALLRRHRSLSLAMPKRKDDVAERDVSAAIISYKDLLISIGAPEPLAPGIGKYLYEVAKWCEDKGHPPVNALAVNGSLRSPGAGYYLAPQGNDWNSEVRDCIAWDRYPLTISE